MLAVCLFVLLRVRGDCGTVVTFKNLLEALSPLEQRINNIGV